MDDCLTRSQFLKVLPVGLGTGAIAPGLGAAKPAQVGAPSSPRADRQTKKPTLLFFFADENSPVTGAVVPTLSWLAEKAGVDFEAYVCIRPTTWAGRILAFNGHGHREQFYYLANFYEKVLYCSLTESHALQFKREVMAFGGDVISTRKPAELLDFYSDVFSYFRIRFPKQLAVLPARPTPEDSLWLQPYCYPDVYFRQALGITEDSQEILFKRLRNLGAEKAALVHCAPGTADLARAAALSAEVVDSTQPGDTYGTTTSRVADRWIKRAKGIAFGDPACTLKWQPFYMREGLITLFEPVDWRAFIKTAGRYARQTGSNVVWGNQMVKPMNDAVVTEFSKEGLVMSLVGPDARIGTTVQARRSLPLDWLRDTPAPWEDESSDPFLLEQAQKGGIPVCFMFYASDLGHLPALHRMLDLMLVEGLKCGLAFPSTWYEFQPELVEQLYIPMDQGGVFPNVEPLIVSAGRGAATEAEGYLDASLLAAAIREAKRSIASQVGERLVPIGYYPFQDACPYYKHKSAEPPFRVLEEAGLRYAISSKSEGENPEVVYRSDRFMAINQQTLHWFTNRKNVSVLARLQDWEKRLAAGGIKGWIILGFDTPFYGLCPAYFRGLESLVESMTYAASGGEGKKLFLAKPHEVIRYARILHGSQQIRRRE